ncbi:glutathione S-transferase C-terminal domain-containing protein [Algibacillus agarilyticus]|uniref:glutathione S-transferase C-terminal domain-containing protein n=1 Tax=Algibacillus agarilyticus TaxID=2234133 RepID=UPI000DCFE2FA|nr:glutathione S-transferase C-terminal domain-containing protein [Algibacillus agarilyticus]
MITLYGFGPRFGVTDASPFVLKIDAFLRLTSLEYQTKTGLGYMRKAPKGKLPFIKDDETRVSDSFFIIQHLKRKYNLEIDAHLTKEQVATSHLITKSLDENFYWCIIYSRWIREDTWPILKQTFFSKFPFPIRYIAPIVARRKIKQTFIKHGMGLHNDAEIMDIAQETIESLAHLLGSQSYIFGDKPSSLDASVFAFLAELILVDLTNPMCELARSYDNLVAYCHRINELYYK